LDECRDSKLYLAMNLSFACSLRIGEILGLTWDNIHVSDQDILEDNAHLYVEKELQRASLQAIKALDQKDVIVLFPAFKPNAVTRLVLKKPKTDSSIRKVWIPKTLAYIIIEYRKVQDNLREMLGNEYFDSNLVVALPNGRPCEERLITEAFQRLREKCDLPNVVFHSLRHSSTTYKLKLNKGDIKATQGDTGHAQADMITRVYAHILDEDRKVNAMKMEQAFYSPFANPDLRAVRPPDSDAPDGLNLDAFIAKLKTASPDKLAVLAELLKA
jgi:integrase